MIKNQLKRSFPQMQTPTVNQFFDPQPIAEIVESARAQLDPYASYGQIFHAARNLQSRDYGLGPLDELLIDPQLTDILINPEGIISTDRGNGLITESVDISTFGSVRSFAMKLATRCGQRLDDAQPFVDGVFVLNSQISIRFHAIIPPLSLDGTWISLRVLRQNISQLDELIAQDTITDEAQHIIYDLIDQRKNIIISGATGSGKTTLLQAMIRHMPPSEKIITLEDSPEIPLMHGNHTRLLTKKPNAEGIGEIPMHTLVKQTLRMRPDRIFLGEIRGGEIADLLQSFNTGHQGGGATLHANSVKDIPARIVALSALSGLSDTALKALMQAVELVFIHMYRDCQRRRKLREIALYIDGSIHMLWSQA